MNALRRSFDVFCATVGLVFLSPVLVVIALAIKLDDRGPVIYSQPRLGKGFRKFRLLKFRTMVPDADRGGPLTAPNDPRITRVGRFLRRYKLDELPQLVNVLIGDMQLVGPRPELERYVEMYRPQYAQILNDRPGITDPATLAYQHEEEWLEAGRVEELYVSKILPHKIELSLEYMRHRTFMSDVGLLIKTAVRIPGGFTLAANSPRESDDSDISAAATATLRTSAGPSMTSTKSSPPAGATKVKRGRPRYELYSSLNQRLIDALITGLAFYLAYQIRFNWNVDAFSNYQLWLLLPAVMLGRIGVNDLCRIYRIIWRFIGLTDSITVARSYVIFSMVLLALRLALPNSLAFLRVPLSIVIIEFLISLTGALGARALRRVLYEQFAADGMKPKEKRRALLIGAGHAGVMVAKELASQSHINPVGFLDDDSRKVGRVIAGLRVLGPVSSLVSVVEQQNIQEVIICIARAPRDVLKRLWVLCEQLSIPAKIVPTVEEILQGKTNIAAFRDVEISDLLGRDSLELTFGDPEVASSYEGKRILITGAGGSIGSELATQLAKFHPSQLILLDKDENGLNDACLRVGIDNGQPIVYPVVADLRFSERLRAVFSSFSPEIIFHAAAHKHVYLMEMNPCEAILNNILGTKNLIEQSIADGVSRFVLISTDKAVRPTCIMGASKRVCEMLVQSRLSTGVPRSCVVRFGNVIGSRGSVIPIFKDQIARGGPITLTHPEVRRYLMTIPEAVYLLIRAGTLASSAETFVLEMGEPVLIQNLARDLIELSGLRPDRDIQIAITGLRPGEKLTELLFDDNKERLLPTRFDKIHLVETDRLEQDGLDEKVSALIEAAHRQDTTDVYKILQKLEIGFVATQKGELAADVQELTAAGGTPPSSVA